jgi:hypothetical protein
MFQILIDLSADPLMMYLVLLEMQTLNISSSCALFIVLICFPLLFQILMDLSADPLIMYYESVEMHTLFTS